MFSLGGVGRGGEELFTGAVAPPTSGQGGGASPPSRFYTYIRGGGGGGAYVQGAGLKGMRGGGGMRGCKGGKGQDGRRVTWVEPTWPPGVQDGKWGGRGDPRLPLSHVGRAKMAAVVVGGIQDGCRVTWVESRWPLWWWEESKMAAESRGSSQDGRCGGGGDPRWLPSHVAGFKLAAVVVVGIQDGLRVTWVDLRWPLWWWWVYKMAAESCG